MARVDTDDIVLVTLMNNPYDMEIVRKEHWYRIPANHAPAHLTQAHYIAFYLTKAFGDAKWSIKEYTPIQGHELVYRRELLPSQADHPRAHNAYYKLQLGPLLVLPRPIVSRRSRRLLFIWTNGARFSTVVTGFLILTTRLKAITQVIGYLVLENGIFIFGLLLLEALPLLVELGVLLDLFVGVFVMGIIMYHINREFASVSTQLLSALKE